MNDFTFKVPQDIVFGMGLPVESAKETSLRLL